jgi:hypothetical protein
VGVWFIEEIDRGPIAVSILTPKELAIIESCKGLFAIDAPDSVAKIVGSDKDAVSTVSPHYVEAIMCVEEEAVTHLDARA